MDIRWHFYHEAIVYAALRHIKRDYETEFWFHGYPREFAELWSRRLLTEFPQIRTEEEIRYFLPRIPWGRNIPGQCGSILRRKKTRGYG